MTSASPNFWVPSPSRDVTSADSDINASMTLTCRLCLRVGNTRTHTTVLWPFFRDYRGEPVPGEIFFWTFMVQGKITEADTSDHLDGRHSIRTYQRPTSVIPPFLRRMSFLPQPSHFILAWNRHRICWLAYPVAWFLHDGKPTFNTTHSKLKVSLTLILTLT